MAEAQARSGRGLALGIGLGAPFARRRLLPPLKEAATSLADVARRPRQALVLFGGAIGITSAYALAFERAVRNTTAPSEANNFAIARPIPRPEPVINATLFCRSMAPKE